MQTKRHCGCWFRIGYIHFCSAYRLSDRGVWLAWDPFGALGSCTELCRFRWFVSTTDSIYPTNRPSRAIWYMFVFLSLQYDWAQFSHLHLFNSNFRFRSKRAHLRSGIVAKQPKKRSWARSSETETANHFSTRAECKCHLWSDGRPNDSIAKRGPQHGSWDNT